MSTQIQSLTQIEFLQSLFHHTLQVAAKSPSSTANTRNRYRTHNTKSDPNIKATQLQLWDTLLEHYQQPHRYYHNLTHIYAMVTHFLRYQKRLNNPTAIILAIFYHDVIYDTRSGDNNPDNNHTDNQTINETSNEVKSAIFFARQLSSLLHKKLIDKVAKLILMTEQHQLEDTDDEDSKLFLDMDLSILGQSPKLYHNYSEAIRKEYAHVNDEAYQQARKRVLEHFLQRPRLYFSNDFYQQFETNARQNLQNELNHLLK